jgi:hypothetical protein
MEPVTVQIVIDVATIAKEIAAGAIAVHQQTHSERMLQYYMDTCENIVDRVKELISK